LGFKETHTDGTVLATDLEPLTTHNRSRHNISGASSVGLRVARSSMLRSLLITPTATVTPTKRWWNSPAWRGAHWDRRAETYVKLPVPRRPASVVALLRLSRCRRILHRYRLLRLSSSVHYLISTTLKTIWK